MNHSETTARSKFQKKQGKSVVDPSGGGETAGILVFLGFQTGRLALFWRGVGTSSSFRAMVFSCRQLLVLLLLLLSLLSLSLSLSLPLSLSLSLSFVVVVVVVVVVVLVVVVV